MPYELAQQYSDIYAEQTEIVSLVHQAVRDLTGRIGPFVSLKASDPSRNAGEAKIIKRNIETPQAQLFLIDQREAIMDTMHKEFLKSHSH